MTMLAPRTTARTMVPGAELELLVLSSGRGGCAAVDLASGALVRAHYPEPAVEVTLQPYDVVVAPLADGDPADPTQPESVLLADLPARVGHLRGRAVARYLRRLVHPAGEPLLGFPGPAAPFWSFRGERPSVAVVHPRSMPVLLRRPEGARCRFEWRGVAHELPLADRRLVSALNSTPVTRLAGPTLTGTLGYVPHHMLVALSPPRHGHCYKVVAALLPRP